MQLSLQENSIGMKRISNKQPYTTSAIIPSVMRSIRYITSWRKKEWIIHSQNSFLQAYACRIIVSNEELKLLEIRSKTAAIPLKNTDHYQVSMSSPCSTWDEIDDDEDGKESPSPPRVIRFITRGHW